VKAQPKTDARTRLRRRLEQLERDGLLRERRVVEGPRGARLAVDGRRVLAFCSNDYLGLASHPDLVAAARRSLDDSGIGAGASALISGHAAEHERLERRLADFVGLPRALYFSTGYMANLGIVPALAGRGDTVFSDELNHASLVDAARLSRADVQVYAHGDLDDLESRLAACASPVKLVASDSVFSMDGGLAPLRGLLELCERHDAWLLLDDAHGFGVLGKGGRGALSELGLASPRIVYMATLGKAAGVFGAFAAGEETVIEWLVQRARTYVFTTASPPALAEAIVESLHLVERDEWRRARLREHVARLRSGLRDLPWRLAPSGTPIQPLIVGSNELAVGLMDALLEAGIWVPAIRPPTVPAGTARLRISLSAAHESEDVDRLVEALRALASHRQPGAALAR
jgi:8-amino-7-oxononanoate synthase